MAGNLKAFDTGELKFFLDRYDITAVDGGVLVSCKGMNRKILHSYDEGFPLSTKIKKINITVEAMETWREKYQGKYSLIEVQNAINTLIITYQKPDASLIDSELKRIRSLLDNAIQ